MKRYTSFFIVLFLLIITLSNCARRGRPDGGPKDEDAPIMITAKPSYLTTNFKEKEIKLYFDEYIKLKDIQTQLIVSPPLKYQPLITPQGTPSKYITIKILDTLKENTTYTFNFGQSVIDNTEGNILQNFKYVFSTGSVIDSFSVKGIVKDAFEREADKNITVMLYDINKEFTDSIIYKEKPMYVANTLDTTIWEITNIKAGSYLLVALNDKAKNYKFEAKTDKIGFIMDSITVPKDTSYILSLFKENIPFKFKRASEAKKDKLFIGYEGTIDTLEVIALDEPSNYESYSLFEKNKDTLNYWFKDASKDSLMLKIVSKNSLDTTMVKLRSKDIDSLQIGLNARSTLNLRDTLKIGSNIPLVSIDTSKVYFVDKDTVAVDYLAVLRKKWSEVIIDLDFKKKFNEKYRLKLYPDAVTDFFGNTNKDTLNFNFSTAQPSDYGNLYITLQNVKSYPLIVQLITDKGEIIQQYYATQEQEYKFLNLVPAKYMVRIIFDDNKNKKWDTGNFLLKIQPEKVVYYPNFIDVRANWDMPETFILN